MIVKKSLLLILVCLLITCTVITIGCKGEEESNTTSIDYKTYSKYNFSFEYPRKCLIYEMGMMQSEANELSGMVQANRVDEELLQVGWLAMNENLWEGDAELLDVLESSFSGFDDDETIESLEIGELVEATKSGHQMIYQDYICTSTEGERFYGVVAVFYCNEAERLYQLMTGNIDTIQKNDILAYFQRFSDSMICH